MKKLVALIAMLVVSLLCFTACNTTPADKTASIEKAEAYLIQMYADAEEETSEDYTLVRRVVIGGRAVAVQWELEVLTEGVAEDIVKLVVGADRSVTVDIPEETGGVWVEYVLKATVSSVIESRTCEFKRTVPPYARHTIPEALEAADDTFVKVTGKVIYVDTAWDPGYGNISVTIADDEENYLYVYRLSTEVEPGDTIEIKGKMTTYGGKRQVAQGCTAEIISSEKDYVVKFAEMTIAEASAKKDCTLVAITGTVTKITSEWSDQYKNMEIEVTDDTGTLAVYRIGTKVELNDIIVVKGKMDTHDGARQIAQGATAEIIGKDQGGNEGGGDTPVVPDEPEYEYEVVVDLSTIETGDKVLIGAPAYGKLLSMVKTGNYNVGVDYSATDFAKVTDDEIFVVTVNADGSYSFTSVSGKAFAMAAEFSSLNDAGEHKTWTVTAAGKEGIYYIKNVGRGNSLEWYNKYSNWSTYNTSSLDDQFEMSFYRLETVEGGDTPVVPDEPEYEYKVVVDLSTIATGDKVLIGAPAYGKLLSMVKTGNYNVGVDYSATDFAKVTDDEIFVVTVNADGSYSFTSVSGKAFAMAAEFSSLNDAGEHKTWTVTAAGKEGIYYIKNVGRGNSLEWYNKYSNWSTYNTSSLDDQFEMSFYRLEAVEGGDTPAVCEHEGGTATCEAKAVCTKCGEAYGELGDHAWNVTIEKQPTCVEAGKVIKTCGVCGETETVTEIDPNGHTPVVDAAVAPTCTTTGLTEGSHCDVCGAVIVAQETVDVIEHAWDAGVATAPTCEEDGYTTYTCTTCPAEATPATKKVVDEGTATGHDWVKPSLTKVPTCTANGEVTYTCANGCGETDVIVLEMLPHTDVDPADGQCDVCGNCAHLTEEDVAAVAPNCTETGLTAGKKCSVCGEITVAQEVVAALGHTEVEDAAVPATCTETGLTAGSHCDVCGEVLVAQTVVKAKGHSWGTVVGNENVCKNDNSHVLSNSELLDKVYALSSGSSLTGTYVLSGVIKSVDTAYSTQYKNVTVTIVVDGNVNKPIQCYRLKGTGADVIAVGDTITVKGTLKNYSGTKEFDSGCTLVSYVEHTVCEYSEATCTTPATCIICGATTGTTADHVYVNGKCECGAEQGVEYITASVNIGTYASANGWTDATKYTSLTIDNNITVSVSGTDQNTGKYYTNGNNWRMYQSGKPSIVISSTTGKKIVSVKITYASQNTGCLTLNGSNITSGAVVEVNASTITFSVGNTGSATNGQARITAIEVVYEA